MFEEKLRNTREIQADFSVSSATGSGWWFNSGLYVGPFKLCQFWPDELNLPGKFAHSSHASSIQLLSLLQQSQPPQHNIPLKLDGSKNDSISWLFWRHCGVMQMLLLSPCSFEIRPFRSSQSLDRTFIHSYAANIQMQILASATLFR